MSGPTSIPRRLDGVWWPRSRDLAAELADLVDHFPAHRLGRVVRAHVSRPDWDAELRHVLVRSGYVKVGSLAEDDTHAVHLTTSDRTLLRVLVVPPSFTRDEGDRALRALTGADSRTSAVELLRRVVEPQPLAAIRRSRSRESMRWGPGA
jgi:hypothetical protein